LSRAKTISNEQTYIGLDLGERRIGVARLNTMVGMAEPLSLIETASQDVLKEIDSIVLEYSANGIVVGLPRGLDGQETSQTAYCREFAANLKNSLHIPVYLIDEAGTSKAADERMGKGSNFSRDSVAAAILLEDFNAYPNKEDLKA
jgi:putative holliday junction resolvase